MSNCLVTQLKASVDNNNLPRLGFIHLHVNDLQSRIQLRLASLGSDFASYIEGDGYFVDSNGENGVKEITFANFNSHNYLTAGTYDLYINKKFGQFNFENMTGGNLEGNIEEFSYMCSDFTFFQPGNMQLSGSLINAMKGNSNVRILNTAFNLHYSGTLSELVSLCPGLTHLNLEGDAKLFTGSLVDLLDANNDYTLKLANLTNLNVRYHFAIINENITVGGVETTALQRIRDLGVNVTI